MGIRCLSEGWAGRPCQVTFPTSTELGAGVPVGVGVGVGSRQLFSSTDTVAEPLLAAARSGLPSRLKSPTATDCGHVPTPKLVAAPKPPVPLPSSTDTLAESTLAVTRSGLPSRLKSPTATDCGSAPTAKLVAAPKPPVPLPNRIEAEAEL